MAHSVQSAGPLPAFHPPTSHAVHAESSLVMMPSCPATHRQSVIAAEPCMSQHRSQPVNINDERHRLSYRGRGGGSLRIRTFSTPLAVCRRILSHFARNAFRIWVQYCASIASDTLAICDVLERTTDQLIFWIVALRVEKGKSCKGNITISAPSRQHQRCLHFWGSPRTCQPQICSCTCQAGKGRSAPRRSRSRSGSCRRRSCRGPGRRSPRRRSDPPAADRQLAGIRSSPTCCRVPPASWCSQGPGAKSRYRR
jgi:hypothetical protein